MAVVSGPRPRARVAPRPQPFAEPRESLLERAGVMRLDFPLLGAVIGLLGLSVVVLDQVVSNELAIRQAIYAVVGLALMFAIAQVDYSRFRELRVGVYTAMIGLIVLVLIVGEATRGARSWIELPFFTFQPSELGKVMLIVALAAMVIDRMPNASERKRTAKVLLAGAVPTALVFLQPDLGSAFVYVAITLTVLFVAGTRWQHLAAIGAAGTAIALVVLVLAPAVGHPILKPYQQDRLTAFLSPSADPADSTYQIRQSQIAVGAGGKTGRGDNATQTRQGFLPERHNDFIFATVGERYGFVGAAFLLSLYALLIWRALRIMTLSKNLYGAIIAGAIAGMLLFHVFVNVGMNIGIAPITGIPLPLVSAGGSSVIATLIAIGLLQSIYVQSQLASRSRV
ncbi:MAG TPA: rod shape-determining protein RodA [Solirubrobacterales bacterium]|jgi:rod shape determining protein RodA